MIKNEKIILLISVNKLGKHSQNNEILLGRSAHSTSDIATGIEYKDSYSIQLLCILK